MRKWILGLLSAALIGCGSSDSSQTAGVPLSINSPADSTAKSATSAAAVAKDTRNVTAQNSAVTSLVKRAQAAVSQGQANIAIESLSQAISIAADNARLFQMRADVYVIMGEYANARVDYSLAVTLDPNNAEVWNARGFFLMNQGLNKESIADFTRATELTPEHTVAWNNLGLVELKNQNYAAAEEHFSQAIKLDPKYIYA